MEIDWNKKYCYSCAETNPPGTFDGACSEKGEIGGDFCNQEHPECWRKFEGLRS